MKRLASTAASLLLVACGSLTPSVAPRTPDSATRPSLMSSPTTTPGVFSPPSTSFVPVNPPPVIELFAGGGNLPVVAAVKATDVALKRPTGISVGCVCGPINLSMTFIVDSDLGVEIAVVEGDID